MFNSIKRYSKNFITYNRTNQYGITLAIIALSFDVLWAGMVAAAVMSGAEISFGWWATLPILFTVLAVAHLVARPIIAPKFAAK